MFDILILFQQVNLRSFHFIWRINSKVQLNKNIQLCSKIQRFKLICHKIVNLLVFVLQRIILQYIILHVKGNHYFQTLCKPLVTIQSSTPHITVFPYIREMNPSDTIETHECNKEMKINILILIYYISHMVVHHISFFNI